MKDRETSEACPKSVGHEVKPAIAGFLGVGALTAFVLFFNLGGARTLTYHEGLVAVVAREMLQTGDWIVPRFGGVPQLTRPPLASWLVASAGSLYGEITEWIVRLPFAFSGFLLTVLVGYWAWRWYGWKSGLWAALVQSTTVYMIMQARLAEADILLCLLTTSALYLVAVDLTGRNALPLSRGRDKSGLEIFLTWIAVYALLGVATLAKEVVGPVLVLLTAVSFILVQRQWKSVWAIVNPAGLALFALLAFAWPLQVGREYPELWTTWYSQSFGRALGGMDREPFWFYAVNVPWLMLPWAPLTAAAAVQSWRKAWSEGDSRERFLWVWFLSQVLFLSLSMGKHKHYVIPALPALSLITGQGLQRLVERIGNGGLLLTARQALWGSFLWSAVGSASVSIVARIWPGLGFPFGLAVVLSGAGGCVALWLLRASRPHQAALAILFAFMVSYASVVGWLLPGRDPRRPAAQFARKVSSSLPLQSSVVVYAMQMSPVIFYLNRAVIREETMEGLRDRLAREGRIYVVTERQRAAQLVELGTVRQIDEMAPSIESHLKKSPRLIAMEMSRRPTGKHPASFN